jgi:DNA primase
MIDDILEKKGIKYALQGNDYLVKCLNPEHDDSNPSMRIDSVTGIFNCFSCGYKGSVLTLFNERVNHLQVRRELLKQKIIEKRAESIGLSFPFNYTPYLGNWRGIRPETYRKFEAFQHTNPDFINRINFPIRDMSDKIVAFNGRHLTDGIPKYKISPRGAKMPLYPKVTPKSGKIILVEGIFDMINLHDKGLTNVVCCFGTSNINEDKLSMLSIQGASGIDVFFDGDDAGQEGAVKVEAMCERAGLLSRNICFKNTDPGELAKPQIDKLKSKLYA